MKELRQVMKHTFNMNNHEIEKLMKVLYPVNQDNILTYAIKNNEVFYL